MSEVFHELDFTYRGRAVTFVPDMALLRRLNAVCKDSGTTLVEVSQSLANRNPDMFTLGYALQKILAAAGIEEAEATCYQWIATGAGGNADEMSGFMAAFLNTVFPAVDGGKKPEAPTSPSKARAKKATGK